MKFFPIAVSVGPVRVSRAIRSNLLSSQEITLAAIRRLSALGCLLAFVSSVLIVSEFRVPHHRSQDSRACGKVLKGCLDSTDQAADTLVAALVSRSIVAQVELFTSCLSPSVSLTVPSSPPRSHLQTRAPPQLLAA